MINTVYTLAREWETPAWLCPVALAARVEAGWQVREAKTVSWSLTCDDAHDTGCCTGSTFGEPIEKPETDTLRASAA